MNTIKILPIKDVEDFRQLEEVQRIVWDVDERELIPARFMHSMEYNGACVLGAYDGDRIVGYIFGLLGTLEDLKKNRKDTVAAARLQMYSVIMGVLPEYQNQGLGYRLKLAQREFAIRIGIRLLTWTFDPLESLNGYFNVSKLGVISHQYLRDFHGQMGGLNAGLPTDRFYIEWWISGNRVQERVTGNRGPLSFQAFINGGAIQINKCERDARDLLIPPNEFEETNNRLILVEIPFDFQNIKQRDMGLAKTWRMHTRKLFEHYFDEGFLVTDFARNQDDDGFKRSYYILTRMGILNEG